MESETYDEIFEPFDEKLFKCQWKTCSETFNDFAYFFSHCRKAHSGDYLDDKTVCGWRGCVQDGFPSLEQLYTHTTVHVYNYKIMTEGYKVLKTVGFDNAMCHQGTSTRCDISLYPTDNFICAWKDCNGKFNDYNLFVEHIGYHAIEDVTIPLIAKEKLRKIRYAQCLWLECGKDFKTKTHLKTHLLSHSFGKNYACPVCGVGFVNRSQFLNHCYRQKISISVDAENTRKRKNSSNSEEDFVQDESEEKKIADSDSVTEESCDISVIENGLPCPHCSKIFPSQQLYHQHVARHERRHKCPECRYIAPYPSNLKAHIKYKHSKERNFACKFCTARFKTNNDLVRHVHLHSNPQANNICDICSKSYTTPYSLKRHQAEHSRVSQTLFKFQCEVCQARFESLETITDHLKTEHSNFSVTS